MDTFNRTSMELKHVLGAGGTLGKASFNRTSMELKHSVSAPAGGEFPF